MNYKRTTRRVIEDPLYGTVPIAGIKKATGAAQSAASTAAQTGGQLGQQAQDVSGFITPVLKADVTNPQGFSAADKAAMLGTGLGAVGGAASGIAGEAGLRAARSRNIGSQAGVLDEAAREKMRTSADIGLGVEAKNAALKQEQRGSALKQLESMYGTELGGGLKAQSLVPEDIDAWAKANETGWVQNVDQTITALKGGSKGPMAYL